MKKTTKFAAFLIATSILVSVLPIIGYAQTNDEIAEQYKVSTELMSETSTYENYKYQVLANGTIEITDYTGYDSELVIPDVIDGKSVTSIGYYAFSRYDDLISIILPDTISNISFGAFQNCTNLVNIVIPDNVTQLPTYAFDGCNNLTNVTLPNSLIIIGDYTFRDCENLEKIAIPDSVTTIGTRAFDSCTSLTSITLSSNITFIGLHAFEYCSSLTDIIVSENNSHYCSVDGNLFNRDKTELIQYAAGKSITEYSVPDGVTKIYNSAFFYCDNLTSISIPNSITNIASSAFRGCKNLRHIIVDENNNNYCSLDGNLFNKDKTVLYQYAIGKYDSEYIVPDGVTTIDAYAFENCTYIENVLIPDSAITIGNSAFRNCTNLEKITIPDSVTYIGQLILNSTALFKNELNWENDVLYVGNHLIYAGNQTPIDYTINQGTLTIADDAFYASYSENIIIPDSVINIVEGSVSNSYLINIIVSEDNTKYCSIDGNLFSKDKTKLIRYAPGKADTEYIIPNGVKIIDNFAFSRCSNLIKITMPNSLTTIGNSAFEYCDNLTDINIPDSLTTIGEYAFSPCNITNFVIPSSVTYIGSYALHTLYTSPIIYGYPNTSAEKYAEKYGTTFKEIDQWTQPTITITEKNSNIKEIEIKLNTINITSPQKAIMVFKNGTTITNTVEVEKNSDDLYCAEIPTDATSVKLFFWDSFNDMHPVAKPLIIGLN